MKQKKENRIALLLQWAGEQKIWLLLAILLAMASGLCIIVPYIGIYRLMDAAFQHICTKRACLTDGNDDLRFCGPALCFIRVFRCGGP